MAGLWAFVASWRRLVVLVPEVLVGLETGWEGTTALLEQGIREGALRPFPIPIFKLMMETTLQQFFRNDVLLRSGISYQEALGQVVDILLRGILSPGEELPQ